MLAVSRRTGYHKVFSVSPYWVTRDGGVSRKVGCHVVLGVMRFVDYVLFLAVMCLCCVE